MFSIIFVIDFRVLVFSRSMDREIFKSGCRQDSQHVGYVSLHHVALALRDRLQVDGSRGFDSRLA
jgi:hypothetical protein